MYRRVRACVDIDYVVCLLQACRSQSCTHEMLTNVTRAEEGRATDKCLSELRVMQFFVGTNSLLE